MKYVVYCDESRHVEAKHRYMAIGGLWLPEAEKFSTSRGFRNLCRSLGLRAEVKWSKTSSAKLDAYKQLVDFFFDTPGLYYRVIVVDQLEVNENDRRGGDAELDFYKFYFQMLKGWMFEGNEYLVLLDHKSNKGNSRYRDLRILLQRRASLAHAVVRDLTVINSIETPLAQLCDILTGAVAASLCADAVSAKEILVRHIKSRAGVQHFHFQPPSRQLCKFHVSKIELRGDDGQSTGD